MVGVRLSSVEVVNTITKQWYAAPPTPTPWSYMKTAIVGDTCYFMGGYAELSCSGGTIVHPFQLSYLRYTHRI